jgi:putative transposase
MKAIAQERRRFGYRRLHVLLRREGFRVNHKRLFRLYREERLMVRQRGGRKRAIGTRAPMMIPMRPNQRWSLDFVADQMTDGRRFRMLAIVDDCTRERLALVADMSLSGVRVTRELDRLLAERGRPKMIVSDNVLCREAALGLGQQVSCRRRRADVGSKLIQMVSTVNGIVPSHSKHRIQRH